MLLFLIRHGETEHNRAGLLAGITDSNLTHHGVLQTQRLGKYLVKDRKLQFTHIYASDLKRAVMTAEEIRTNQNDSVSVAQHTELVKLALLREQDLGSLELVPWSSKRDSTTGNSSVPKATDPGFKPKETKEAMTGRSNSFLDDYVLPLFALEEKDKLCIAVVSHGLFLSNLWKALLRRLNEEHITLGSSLSPVDKSRPLQHLGGWSNTGFLELRFKSRQVSNRPSHAEDESLDPSRRAMIEFSNSVEMMIVTINGKDHLQNFKRARGGLGNVTFDERQTKVDGYFKRAKVEKKIVRSKPEG